MKNKRNTIVKSISKIVIVLAITCSTGLNAAVEGGPTLGGASNNDVQDNPDSIPLDGGLTALLIGAAAFGIKKLRDSRKKDM